MQDIHCPSCGEVRFEDVIYPDDVSGTACPNGCGWIEPETDGDALVVRVGIASY